MPIPKRPSDYPVSFRGLDRLNAWFSVVAQYYLRISQGAFSGGPDHVFESEDQNTAWIEMTKVCGDFIGSACRKLDQNSNWVIELLDKDKKCTARIRLVAENLI